MKKTILIFLSKWCMKEFQPRLGAILTERGFDPIIVRTMEDKSQVFDLSNLPPADLEEIREQVSAVSRHS